MTQEKNDAALAFNEVEIKNKELKEEFNFLLDKEKKVNFFQRKVYINIHFTNSLILYIISILIIIINLIDF